jgi:hypothetical protein
LIGVADNRIQSALRVFLVCLGGVFVAAAVVIWRRSRERTTWDIHGVSRVRLVRSPGKWGRSVKSQIPWRDVESVEAREMPHSEGGGSFWGVVLYLRDGRKTQVCGGTAMKSVAEDVAAQLAAVHAAAIRTET